MTKNLILIFVCIIIGDSLWSVELQTDLKSGDFSRRYNDFHRSLSS